MSNTICDSCKKEEPNRILVAETWFIIEFPLVPSILEKYVLDLCSLQCLERVIKEYKEKL